MLARVTRNWRAPASRSIVAFERWVMGCAHDVRRVYWFVVRPETRSVKCLLTSSGSVLLIRHTYGERARWRLPGGGIKAGEKPLAAIQRELREELGIETIAPEAVATIYEKKHAGTTYHCFEAELDGSRLTPNARELAEARWFPRDGLPLRREWLVSHLLHAATRR
jgi:ADP-ribose pyrophosphatase YjhB (NUDIX family)